MRDVGFLRRAMMRIKRVEVGGYRRPCGGLRIVLERIGDRGGAEPCSLFSHPAEDGFERTLTDAGLPFNSMHCGDGSWPSKK